MRWNSFTFKWHRVGTAFPCLLLPEDDVAGYLFLATVIGA